MMATAVDEGNVNAESNRPIRMTKAGSLRGGTSRMM
jgi:hypothetical protein